MARYCLTLIAFFFAATAALAQTSYYLAPDVYNGFAQAKQVDRELADKLFNQVKESVESGDLTQAMRLLGQTLHNDPGHQAARRAMGYELNDESNKWQTPFEAKQFAKGLHWNRRFGWVRPEDLPRLQSGERLSGKRWISAKTDTKRHQEIDKGWQVRTDHFVVTTNHSLEAGVALAGELESFWQLWQQRLAPFDLTERELTERLAGKRAAPKSRRPMRVYYHRDKTSYVEHLKRRQPRIAETLGIYFDTIRQSHFYHSNNVDNRTLLRSTLYHEATHQLLQETSPKGRTVGQNANFWIVEGIACYFETLTSTKEAGIYELGDPRRGRFATAVSMREPTPLHELAALGMSDLQSMPSLATLYAQSTALAGMLIDSPSKMDQQNLVKYLKRVYDSRPDGEEMTRQMGRSFKELDREYQIYLAQIAQQIVEQDVSSDE